MADPPGCQNAPILKQSSSGSTPKPPRGLFPMITTDEDPYGPMAGHFYTNSRNQNSQNQNTKIPNSQSVLTSPESRPPSCAYHSSKIQQNTTTTNNSNNHQILSGSSADLRHYHHQVQCSKI